ncbi:MAG: hypothetical protein AAGI92_08450 [Pseudomonadota bacterium]
MFLGNRSLKNSGTQIVGVVLGTIGAIVLSALPAAAHVRWFVDENDPNIQIVESFSIIEPLVLIWIAIAIAAISASVFLDTKLPKIQVVDSRTRHDVMEFVRIFVGMSFLLTAYEGALLAPHLSAIGVFGGFLVIMQAFIGVILIANRFLQHAAILMFLLFFGTVIKFGFLGALEYSNIVGIGLFILFNNFKDETLIARFKPYSVPALRIFTGVALVALAFGEKLYGAFLGNAFIANFGWNFMPAIGLDWFDDRTFILAAGVVEATFGIILILGTTTRLTILALSILMAASNIAFIVQGYRDEAMVEFIGHLPVIATALLLLFLGYGQRLKVTNHAFFTGERRVDNTAQANPA